MVKGKSGRFAVVLKVTNKIPSASSSLAILPSMGARRWSVPTREHDKMYGKQLFDIGFLEGLASEFQPVDCKVFVAVVFFYIEDV